MTEEKKVKQTTVRFFEEDLSEIAELAKKLNVPQAELVNEWRKSYERLRLEETNSQGENLRTLRSYTDKIMSLFTVMTESTEEHVLNEQKKAFEAEKRYTDQVVKTNTLKETLEKALEEQKTECEKLLKELKKYQAFEETVEGRIKDKEQLIEEKEGRIQSLSKKLMEVQESLQATNELHVSQATERKKWENSRAALQGEVEELKRQLKENEFKNQNELQQKDMESQRQLLHLREELQEKYESKIEKMYDSEHEKREQVRKELEARLREEHVKEIERIRKEHTLEIERLRQERKPRS